MLSFDYLFYKKLQLMKIYSLKLWLFNFSSMENDI